MLRSDPAYGCVGGVQTGVAQVVDEIVDLIEG
jgi:hypothetical protein